MLTRIRGTLNSFVVLVLMGLLIAVFALWGIGDIFRNPGVQSVATVDGEDIPINEFAGRLQRIVREQQQANPDFDLALAIRLGYDRIILSQMVRDAVIAQEARDLGLTASNKQVSKMIAEEDAFKLAGEFDVTRYQQFLRTNNLSEEELFDNIRADRARIDFMTGLTNGVIAPQLMVDAQVRYLTEQRTGTVVTLPVANYRVSETPDEATLQAFFEERMERYRTPEYRSFNYVAITVEDIAKSIDISDEQLAAEYEARQDLYTTPELRRVEQVVLQSEEEAQKFIERVNAGEDFAAVAQDMGGFSAEDISLGDLSRSDIASQYGEETADTIFALDENAVSQAIETPFGQAVYRVTQITPGVERPLEDVREELRALVAQDQALTQIYELSQQLDDAFATGANLSEAAQSVGLEMRSVNRITRTGETASGEAPANAALVRDMLDTVFQLNLGDVVETLPLGETGYFAPEITAVDPERPMTLEEAREQLIAEWQRIETDRRAREAAEAIANEVDSAAGLAYTAKDRGLDVIENISFTRLQLQQGGTRSTAAAQILFSIEKGKADVSPSAGGGNYVIAFLSDIEEGTANRDSLEYTAIADQITRLLQNDIQGQYLEALQKRYDVRINERALQAYRDQVVNPTAGF